MKSLRRPNHGAFTLIELLVVITVIAILSGLVLNTAGYIQKKSARSRAEAEVAALSAAIESYKLDNGDYPSGTNSDNTSNKYLFDKLNPSSGKVYFEFNAGMTNSSGNIVDPFGKNYCYKYPDNTQSGEGFFDLWSTGGANPSTDESQWIKNW